MKILVRAVVSGFGFSLGAALFKKVSDKLGLGEDKSSSGKSEIRPDPESVVQDKTPAREPDGSAGYEGI